MQDIEKKDEYFDNPSFTSPFTHPNASYRQAKPKPKPKPPRRLTLTADEEKELEPSHITDRASRPINGQSSLHDQNWRRHQKETERISLKRKEKRDKQRNHTAN